MNVLLRRTGWLVVALLTACGVRAAGEKYEPMKPEELKRICFLGDSITDGDTYPRLVETALNRAGIECKSINAGYGGNTAEQMLARVDKDVLANKPTLVTINSGANDAMRGVAPEVFEKATREKIEKIKAAGIPMILVTQCGVTGKSHEKGEAALVQYNEIYHKLAKEYGLRIADVFTSHREAIARGEEIMDVDGLHPAQRGQQLIAQAILDAIGHPELQAPDMPDMKPAAGLITPWKMVALEGKKVKDEEVLALQVDDTWKDVTVPSPDPHEKYWLEHNRQLGVAVNLDKYTGGKAPFVGRATIESDQARPMQFHTGGLLGRIWLNGELIYKGDWNGWHPGRYSVTGNLKQGANEIVILTNGEFFLSVTEGPFWE
jgi:acyl-CoA thioesterase-1